ncbi:MAG TPA: PD-(D/E)XK nuclease superfamily protein [Candidatus Baltobacteraceae bacterium]|nr:PD-(D/E)XK nuclease superfamily protein [Candidatus Baltobacteraceae bacterium]
MGMLFPGSIGTKTGSTLEVTVEAVLLNNSYAVSKQQIVGSKPGGGRHKADLVGMRPNGSQFLVSLKWQQTTGSAEEKIPFEVIKLLHTLRENPTVYDKAYIVVGGDGFNAGLIDFYLSEEFRSYIRDSEKIEILTLNDIMTRANRGAL